MKNAPIAATGTATTSPRRRTVAAVSARATVSSFIPRDAASAAIAWANATSFGGTESASAAIPPAIHVSRPAERATRDRAVSSGPYLLDTTQRVAVTLIETITA